MRHFLLFLVFFISAQLCVAQDWHPFPIGQKKEYFTQPSWSAEYNNHFSYFVDSVRIENGKEHLIVGGNYFYEIFGDCAEVLFDPSITDGNFGGFCPAYDQPYYRVQDLGDEYVFKDNQLSYILSFYNGVPPNNFVYDTMSFSLNLNLLDKDTFTLIHSDDFDEIVVTCIEEGNSAIIGDYIDDYKAFSFEAYQNGISVSDFNNNTFILTKTLGLTQFFHFEGFRGISNQTIYELAAVKVNDSLFGIYPITADFVDPIKVGNIYKWQYSSEDFFENTISSGWRRDSIVSIQDTIMPNGDSAISIISTYNLAYNTVSTAFPSSPEFTFIENKIGARYIKTEELSRQKHLIHDYYNPTNDPTYFVESWPYIVKDGEGFITYGLKTEADEQGIYLDDWVWDMDTVACCLYAGWTEGDNGYYFGDYTYSTITGLYHESYGSNYEPIELELIGFQSADTIFGDVAILNTTEIIPLSISQLKISPNPADDIINIAVTDSFIDGNAHLLKVFDINGTLVMTTQQVFNKSIEININQLNKGMYFVTIQTEQGILTGRFIRQ